MPAGGTRTCIHTPGAAFQPEEMTPELISTALQDAALVYFDGRLTEAAILLAKAARAAGVPVLVEGERLRPGLQDLLAQADYVVTSAHFPQVRNRLLIMHGCIEWLAWLERQQRFGTFSATR